MRSHLIQAIICLSFILLSTQPGFAKSKYFFKIATIAPEGSVWIDQFKAFTKEVEEKTGGEVGFRIYPSGVMGDDQAMLRKMRAGQLHGGGFTMTGIANTVPDFRVMALPFLFKTYEEVDAVTKGLYPDFKEAFSKKGYELLATNEVGFIYTMSTKPALSPADLRNSKCWIPPGDPIAESFLKNIGVTPIQLSIPDVLSSLQTGLVDTVFNSPYGAIVLQWFTKATHVTTNPYGYGYGAVILDKKAFNKLPKEYGKIIHEAASKHFSILLDATRKSNAASIKELKDQGVSFAEADPAGLEEMLILREKTVKQLIGKAFSEEIYDKTTKLLEASRKSQ